jgi:hypothetical protein
MPEPVRPEDIAAPAHPDRMDDADPPAAGSARAGIAVAVLLGLLVALIVVLHLTGAVGPGAH